MQPMKTDLWFFARMDSNRAHEDLYRAHPGWFAVDADGKPYRRLIFITCVNSPYYNEHIPSILTEIAVRYHPKDLPITAGADWAAIQYAIVIIVRKASGKKPEMNPAEKELDDPVYRQWIRWNYDRGLEIWDLNNRTTRAAGGPDCIWPA